MCVHLVGLHLVLEDGIAPPRVPRRLQALAAATTDWPHFEPPADGGNLTIADVALAEDPEEHATIVRLWAEEQWRLWRPHRSAVAVLAASVR